MERVLAIDPALRHTGYAIIQRSASGPEPVAFGVLANPARLPQTACLLRIHDGIRDLIAQHRPTVCAVEGIIFVQSHATAITLGAARGAALVAAAAAGLPVHEYAPRRVKQAVVGRGAAEKSQVAFMIRVLLRLTETPAPDAADALAIGLAHLQAHDPARPRPSDPAQPI